MRILVVEDDRLLNNTLCYNLSTAGYSVDAALTKTVAIHLSNKQDYDLIVLDINLPHCLLAFQSRTAAIVTTMEICLSIFLK
jgi:DNA-binding response OmpR family regulator